MLEVAAEGGLVGEMHRIGNLLDTHIGVDKVVLAHVDGEERYPLQCALACGLLDDGGEVVGREVEAVGIVLYGALSMGVLEQQHEEVAHDGLVLAGCVCLLWAVGEEDAYDLDQDGAAQVAVAKLTELPDGGVGELLAGYGLRQG